MDDVNLATCIVCNTEKHVQDFHDNFGECKKCKNKRV